MTYSNRKRMISKIISNWAVIPSKGAKNTKTGAMLQKWSEQQLFKQHLSDSYQYSRSKELTTF